MTEAEKAEIQKLSDAWDTEAALFTTAQNALRVAQIGIDVARARMKDAKHHYIQARNRANQTEEEETD